MHPRNINRPDIAVDMHSPLDTLAGFGYWKRRQQQLPIRLAWFDAHPAAVFLRIGEPDAPARAPFERSSDWEVSRDVLQEPLVYGRQAGELDFIVTPLTTSGITTHLLCQLDNSEDRCRIFLDATLTRSFLKQTFAIVAGGAESYGIADAAAAMLRAGR